MIQDFCGYILGFCCMPVSLEFADVKFEEPKRLLGQSNRGSTTVAQNSSAIVSIAQTSTYFRRRFFF